MSAIFNPPLSTQRYCWVQEFIKQDQSIKSVTDVGCAHGRMLIWLKHIPNLDLVNFIDKDLSVLDDGVDYCFQPNLYDMLFGRKNSEKQLDIKVYHGDIVVPDDRLKADCFTMVEMIEHIPLDHLEKVCQTVFGYYKPRFIIVSTPNSEFNPLLKAYAAAQRAKREQAMQQLQAQQQTQLEIQSPSSQTSEIDLQPQSGVYQNNFRHSDHKFEWTRSEFNNWAELMCKTYSYEVFFSGVGELPNSKAYGPCTQIALFSRIGDCASIENESNIDPTLCFDLFLNKLSVQEELPEFMGDPTLRKICLRAQYYIPGTTASNRIEETNYNSSWSDIQEDEDMPIQT